MSNTILIKKSTTPNAVPNTTQLALGELAINTYDGRLFTKIDTGSASVFELTQNQPITVTGNVTGNSVNGVGNTTIDLTLTTTGVVANTYGGTTGATSNIGVFTVDQYGRITSASNVAISTSSLANGTSNIQIYANGNIAINSDGTSNVAVFSNTGAYITGLASVTGNVISGNVSTGNVSANNVTSTGIVSAFGNITGGNIDTLGNVTANGILTDNYYYANGAPVDFQQPAGSNTQIQFNNNNDFGASANFTFDTNTNQLFVGGTANIDTVLIQSGNISGGGTGIQLYSTDYSQLNYNDESYVYVNASGISLETNGGTAVMSTNGNVYLPVDLSVGGNIANAASVTATGNVVGGNIISDSHVITSNITSSTGGLTVDTANGNLNLLPVSGNIVVNTYINGVLDPVQNQDAATKAYVDNMVSTGIAYHPPVYVATTSNLATATGGTVTYTQPNGAGNGQGAYLSTTGSFNLIDTANVQTLNTRILVKDEANAAWNGVYFWSNATTIIRTTDTDEYGPDSAEQLSVNDYFFVQSGNINAGASYIVNSPAGVITFGTSNITFAEFSKSQVYTANTQAGLSLNGTVFNAKVDNDTTAFDGGGNIIVKASANLVTPNIGAATGQSLSVTGNVDSGNVNTGLLSVTGNIQVANVNATLVSATGNVVAGNLNTGGLASVAGNVIAGNVETAGLANVATLVVTNWANITGNTVSTSSTTGALIVAGGLGVAGNVYGGSLYSGGDPVLTNNSTIDGGTY